MSAHTPTRESHCDGPSIFASPVPSDGATRHNRLALGNSTDKSSDFLGTPRVA
eukprot:COSAG02_NODE_44280_length_367_cov_1.414179_1_plen_52_part_01